MVLFIIKLFNLFDYVTAKLLDIDNYLIFLNVEVSGFHDKTYILTHISYFD